MNVDPRLVGAILRNDFYSFIRAIFPIVSSNDAFASNWHIEAIAYQLTRVLKGEIKRLIITVPPRASSRSAPRSHSLPSSSAMIPHAESFVSATLRHSRASTPTTAARCVALERNLRLIIRLITNGHLEQ